MLAPGPGHLFVSENELTFGEQDALLVGERKGSAAGKQQGLLIGSISERVEHVIPVAEGPVGQ